MANGYGATSLTGGTTGCLDAINGATLSDGDKAFVVTTTQLYVYNLSGSSGASESSPSVIAPDTNAGTKRWILAYIVTNGKGIDEGRYAADAEASDTYVVALSPAPTAYYTGMAVYFSANTANTGAATLNVNSLGAKTIKKNYNSDLATGDILAGQIVGVVYDGTNFQIQSQLSGLATAGANLNITSLSGLTTLLTLAQGGIGPLGAANTKLFVNAAGTLAEWGAGSNVVATTHDISVTGDQAITGMGFKGNSFLILAGVNGTATAAVGLMTGATGTYCLYNSHLAAANTWSLDGANIYLSTGAGVYATIILKSRDADGLTITWAKVGAPTGTASLYISGLR